MLIDLERIVQVAAKRIEKGIETSVDATATAIAIVIVIVIVIDTATERENAMESETVLENGKGTESGHDGIGPNP